MDKKKEEDPNKPFSVARVAVWALGVIGAVCASGFIVIAVTDAEVDSNVTSGLRGVTATAVGGLVAVAAARNR